MKNPLGQFSSLKEFAEYYNLSRGTVAKQLKRGYCKWPKKEMDGKFSHHLYRTWRNIIFRCTNPNNPGYKNYGGRGITVAPEWQSDFWQFIRDMGERPSKHHSVDRIDNSKGYYKDNCRWATRSEQNQNTRVYRAMIYKHGSSYYAKIKVCGRTLGTAYVHSYEQAEIDRDQLLELYKDYR